jgi:hypothetical protein
MTVTIWRVSFFAKGERPIVDDMRRLRDAWVLAQPYPELDDKDWTTESWETVKKRFEEEKETSMLVSWTKDHSAHTIIDKIEADAFPDDD